MRFPWGLVGCREGSSAREIGRGEKGAAWFPATPLRFIARYVLPALALFVANVHSPKTSGRRLALLAAGGEGAASGKYFSDGKEIRSSDDSYDPRTALDLWNGSAEMTGLPSEI